MLPKYCPNCGTKLNLEQDICMNCGRIIQSTKQNKNNATNPGFPFQGDLNPGVVAALVIVIVFGFLAAFFFVFIFPFVYLFS